MNPSSKSTELEEKLDGITRNVMEKLDGITRKIGWNYKKWTARRPLQHQERKGEKKEYEQTLNWPEVSFPPTCHLDRNV
jgi:hypothetical protein